MDRAEIDLDGNGILFFGDAKVTVCRKVDGQPNVFYLATEIVLERKTQVAPAAGQFYMLRAKKSSVQLDRPISVYHSSEKETDGKRIVTVEYMILEKGTGTKELCSLESGDSVECIGPLGNTFGGDNISSADCGSICIIGGGIGVAPVANFASSLEPQSYDFYACFKSGTYALENVQAKNLFVTTDDGSAGIKGMLPCAIDGEKIKALGYTKVFACGPTPMLVYVQKICREAGIKCWLSMENRMACGVGACLGCTIKTSLGNKRVCKDGPVFDSEIILFEPLVPVRKGAAVRTSGDSSANGAAVGASGAGSANTVSVGASGEADANGPDVSVTIKGVRFANPVIAASGTFGFGQNYRGICDVNRLGGISSKGMTLNGQPGNEGQRLVETPAGLINSIGLENPGVKHFIQYELPEMLKLEPVAIANLAGHTLEEYVEGAALLDATDVPVIELNISCPNVKAGGMAFGTVPETAAGVVGAVRKATRKPLIVKLSPNAPDLVGVALACVKAGADALSLINTIQAVSINIETGRPVFKNIRAGLCGPAVKPIALRMVYDVCEAMNKLPAEERVPVIGIGGISCWQDAVEFIMAGASAVQVGTATFSNPKCMEEIVDGIKAFMVRKNYKCLDDFRGCAISD